MLVLVLAQACLVAIAIFFFFMAMTFLIVYWSVADAIENQDIYEDRINGLVRMPPHCFVPVLPHAILIEVETGPRFRTSLTTCYPNRS